MRLADPCLVHRRFPRPARDEAEAVLDGVLPAEHLAGAGVDHVMGAFEIFDPDPGLVGVHDHVGPHRCEEDAVGLLVDEGVRDAGTFLDFRQDGREARRELGFGHAEGALVRGARRRIRSRVTLGILRDPMQRGVCAGAPR